MKKYVENMHQKLVPDHYLILVNSYKYSQRIQKIILNIRCFLDIRQKGTIKVSLYGIIKNKWGLELVPSPFSGCQICSENFSLVTHYLAIFDASIDRGF